MKFKVYSNFFRFTILPDNVFICGNKCIQKDILFHCNLENKEIRINIQFENDPKVLKRC
jgi:hypothetical protein